SVVTLNRADTLSASALLSAIKRELPGTVTTEGSGDLFVFYDPDGVTVPERRFPFITVVTGDRYDAASRLDRDAASFRVTLGGDLPPYEALLGPAPRQAAGREVIDTGSTTRRRIWSCRIRSTRRCTGCASSTQPGGARRAWLSSCTPPTLWPGHATGLTAG